MKKKLIILMILCFVMLCACGNNNVSEFEESNEIPESENIFDGT